jgi:very-long-chain (3R)-3-hydroxyacyl-CoA dehydratase
MEDQISRKRQPQRPQSVFTKQNYLLAYNGVSLALWGIITLRAAFLIPILVAHGKLFGLLEALQPLVTFTQTLAVVEIAHALLGLVRASPMTTAMQVASRLMLVWGVVGAYPQIVATTNTFGRAAAGPNGGPIAFSGILLAWSVTESIRYGFFVWKEGVDDPRVPPWLAWLRYNTFFVLYPLGISSECWLICLALTPAARAAPWYNAFLKAVLLIYVPGSSALSLCPISWKNPTVR